MKIFKLIVLYIIIIIINYIFFTSFKMFNYHNIDFFQANSAYSFSSNTIISINSILNSTVHLLTLNYIINKIDDLVNMRDYISIRLRKMNKFLLLTIFKYSILIGSVKLIVDLILTRFQDLKLVFSINLSIILTLIIYSLFFYIFLIIFDNKKMGTLYIVCLSLISNILYANIHFFSILVFVPYQLFNEFNYLNSCKSVFIVILILFIVNKKETIV